MIGASLFRGTLVLSFAHVVIELSSQVFVGSFSDKSFTDKLSEACPPYVAEVVENSLLLFALEHAVLHVEYRESSMKLVVRSCETALKFAIEGICQTSTISQGVKLRSRRRLDQQRRLQQFQLFATSIHTRETETPQQWPHRQSLREKAE